MVPIVLGTGSMVPQRYFVFRTWVQERTNFPREVGEAALAHKLGDAAEQAYARSDLVEKRRMMMDSWAGYLASQVGKLVAFPASSNRSDQ